MLLNLATKDSGGNSCVLQKVVWNKRAILPVKSSLSELFSIITFLFELASLKLSEIKESKDTVPASVRRWRRCQHQRWSWAPPAPHKEAA